MTKRKRTWIAVLFGCLLPLSAVAQDSTGTGLVVRSNPPGAEVTLKGDATVTGIAPTWFQHRLAGSYQLEVKRHGYETHKTRLTLDPSRLMEIDVNLTPKTRFKAFARSLIIPGWGQRYTDQPTKGFLFHLLAAGSVAAFLIAEQDFDDKFDIYEDRLAAYDSAQASGAEITDLRRLHGQLVTAQDDAYDAETFRNITIGVGAGVWALNLIDVLFFYPEERGIVTVRGLSVAPGVVSDNPGITLTHKF
jgi:hypothetical protein